MISSSSFRFAFAFRFRLRALERSLSPFLLHGVVIASTLLVSVASHPTMATAAGDVAGTTAPGKRADRPRSAAKGAHATSTDRRSKAMAPADNTARKNRLKPPPAKATHVDSHGHSRAHAAVENKRKGYLAKPPVLPPPRGKVAVFPFRGDDLTSAPVRAQVVRALRAKGLKVVTNLRPVDSAEQFRDMAITLNLAVYVDGEVNEDGDLASATVHVRSGVTGLRVASATFSGERRKLAAEVAKTLWTEVGPALSRVCAEAAKPRKQEHAPMRIEAGTPIENPPPEEQEGT